MPDNHSSDNSDRVNRRTDRFPSQDKATDAMSTLRRMPESLAAEAAVIGSMIIDPVCIGDASMVALQVILALWQVPGLCRDYLVRRQS